MAAGLKTNLQLVEECDKYQLTSACPMLLTNPSFQLPIL
jgi:hypothetical protein